MGRKKEMVSWTRPTIEGNGGNRGRVWYWSQSVPLHTRQLNILLCFLFPNLNLGTKNKLKLVLEIILNYFY
jgi:hypothetical protein